MPAHHRVTSNALTLALVVTGACIGYKLVERSSWGLAGALAGAVTGLIAANVLEHHTGFISWD